MKLVCENCEVVLIQELSCPTEIVTYEGGDFCSEYCKQEYHDMRECAYCEDIAVCEYSDPSYEHEGNTCSSDCHQEAIHLHGYNKGDPYREHRTW